MLTYHVDYKMDPVEHQVVDVTTLFNGYTPQCSFSFQISYHFTPSVIQTYPNSNIRIDATNKLIVHSADGLKPMMIYIKAQDISSSSV